MTPPRVELLRAIGLIVVFSLKGTGRPAAQRVQEAGTRSRFLRCRVAPCQSSDDAAQSVSAVRPWTIAYKKGDVSVHHRVVTLSGTSLDHKTDLRCMFRSTERVDIKDVNARGEATIVVTCASMEIVRDGRAEKIEAAAFPPTTRVFGKNGLLIREVDNSDTPPEPLLAVESLFANNPAPLDSVRPGGSWRTDLQNRLVPGGRVTMVSRFDGIAPIFGISAIKTAFSLAVPTARSAAADAIAVTGERCLDVATGRILRSEIEIRGVPVAVSGGVVRGTAHILDEVVVPGVNDKPALTSTPDHR